MMVPSDKSLQGQNQQNKLRLWEANNSSSFMPSVIQQSKCPGCYLHRAALTAILKPLARLSKIR